MGSIKNQKPRQHTRGHYGHHLLYSARWDAYWCLGCHEWAEPKCSDKECEFCPERPSEPELSIV